MASPLPNDPMQPLPFGKDHQWLIRTATEHTTCQAFSQDVRRNPFAGWWLAVIITVCLLPGLYLGRSYWLHQTIETGFGEVRRVTLNAHSSLRLPRFGFGERRRVVRLAGEATFSVRHLPGYQRFVVQTSKAINVVLLMQPGDLVRFGSFRWAGLLRPTGWCQPDTKWLPGSLPKKAGRIR